MWVAQIMVVMIMEQGRFIADALRILDKYVLFIGAAIYGVMVIYLGISVLKGNLKVGTRFVLITFYPLEPHATLPNAMLFNGLLYALSAFALVQFAASMFEAYVYNSSVGALFSNQMKNLKGIKYVFRYFHYVLLGFIALGLVYSITIQCCVQCYRRRQTEKSMRIVLHR
jgi:hypothetical protein